MRDDKRGEKVKKINPIRPNSAGPNSTATSQQHAVSPNSTSTTKQTVAEPESIATTKQTVAEPESIATTKQTVAEPESIATTKQTVAEPESIATTKQAVAEPESIATTKQAVAEPESIATTKQAVAEPESIATTKQAVAEPELTTINEKKENKTAMKNDQKSTEQTETTPAPMSSKERVAEANHIVKNRMIASVGAGLIPFPVVDIVALTGIQMDTVRALCKLYNVKFSKDVGKTAISSLTGGVVPVATGPLVSSLAKSVPVVGQIMGMASMPVIAGASTYAVGKVFIQHFESGGTFLTFDPEKVKGYFQEEFEKGKEFAKTEAKVS